PAGAGMLAWLFGVIRILYCVDDVVEVMLVERLTEGVSLPGFEEEPWTVEPASFVISTRLRPPEVPEASVTVIAVIVSVPLAVWNVKASTIVAAPPGARLASARSPPMPSV